MELKYFNLRKPTSIAESMENQASFPATIIGFRQPRSELIRQRLDSPLHPPSQIEPKHLRNRNHERNSVNPPRIVQIHVPLQVFRLRSEPTQQNHCHITPFIPKHPCIAAAIDNSLRGSIPGENAFVRIRGGDSIEFIQRVMKSGEGEEKP